MDTHVCPWWMGYFLAGSWRRLVQNPDRILEPYLKEGMTVLEIGPGMGFFTLPIARLVGEKGKIITVDVQEKMLYSLRRRAEKAGLISRIETRLCPNDSLGIENLSGKIDFALIFAVLHEIPDPKRALSDAARALKKDGTLLLSEPNGHVTESEFEKAIQMAEAGGLKKTDTPTIRRSHSAVFRKI